MNAIDFLTQNTDYFADRGISFVTDIQVQGKKSAVANTYFLEVGDKNYMIDPGYGKRRIKQIREQLPFNDYDVLVTHSHLDHSANSRFAAGKNSQVVFHPMVAERINNLKSVYTGILPEMVKLFGIQGVFSRTGVLGPSTIKKMQFIQKAFPALFNFILNIGSNIMCRNTFGVIQPPQRNMLFLNCDENKDLEFANIMLRGWSLSNQLFALDTPGHSNDHLSFYVPDRGVMFSGDLIGFLNPNDILNGSLKETQAGMLKMLQLAEAGGIDILATSHDLPVLGKDNVIAYLRSVIAKQEEAFNTIAAIVSSCADKTDFEEIMTKVYSHESDLIKGLLKVNYPRSFSFIDVYVYIYLKEFVYHTGGD